MTVTCKRFFQARGSWWLKPLLVNTFGCQWRQFSKAESLLCLQKTHCFQLLTVWHALLRQCSFLCNWAGCSANNEPHWMNITFCPLDTQYSNSVEFCEKLLSHQVRHTEISQFISITSLWLMGHPFVRWVLLWPMLGRLAVIHNTSS